MRATEIVAVGLALLSGCSSGQATSSGSLAADAAATTSTWVSLDLQTGQITSINAPDLASPRWRGSEILFRKLPPGVGRMGRPAGDQLTETDERPPRLATTDQVWLGVFELTQAQWERLNGTTPWFDTIPFLDQTTFVSPDRPAFALPPADIIQAAARWSTHGWTIDLPTEGEWETACLSGSRSKFDWGDAADPTIATEHAVCHGGTGDALRPRPVGSRAANAWGFFDMHGNVWELVHGSSGLHARGGAWDQPPLTCRASNRLAIDEDMVGWNVGVRLVVRR